MYNTAHKVGRHLIEVCTCLTCQVCGAYPVAEYLTKKLGVGFGETTSDGVFTLHEVECLNACDRAPLVQVGDQYYGPVDEKSLDALLEQLRQSDTNTVIQMADSIVQVHLADFEKPGGKKVEPAKAPPPAATTPASPSRVRIRVEETS